MEANGPLTMAIALLERPERRLRAGLVPPTRPEEVEPTEEPEAPEEEGDTEE
jgi:hypothetical protein